MISTRNNTGVYYKYMEGDLATIFAEALRTGSSGASPGQFEVHEQTQTVRTVMTGKCAFRYGIEQHVNVEQEKLPDLSSSSIKINELPPRYRPILISNNTH
jgi:DNA-binding NarL/FixJ family response regulator